MKDVIITKASGEKSKFSEEKIRRSLERAGASDAQITEIINQISTKLYEGITTKKIYHIAFNLLREGSRHLAARYHLKTAIMELGPSGFPFENYVAEILKCQGYKTQVGQILQGKCVSHEIDVIAEKDDDFCLVECKFHNQSGKFSDVQIPLYIQSRFKDVEEQWMKLPEHKNKIHKGWVITNTRFSSDAIQYGTCAGLNLLGWNYPNNAALKDLIDSFQLYPITCLTTLTKVEKQRLLDKKIILCKELMNNRPLLETSGVKSTRIIAILKEVEQLCHDHTKDPIKSK